MNLKRYLRNVRGIIIAFAIIFLVLSLSFGVIVETDAFGLKSGIVEIVEQTMDSLLDESRGILGEEGKLSAIGLIKNNSQVAIMSFFLGIIPFLFLPSLVIVVNSLVLGGAMPILSEMTGRSISRIFFRGIVPHGIFELTSIVIAVAVGFNLCLTITKTIFKRKRRMTVKDAFLYGLLSVVVICVPMMIIAGFIEAYITPIILGA